MSTAPILRETATVNLTTRRSRSEYTLAERRFPLEFAAPSSPSRTSPPLPHGGDTSGHAFYGVLETSTLT